MGTLTGSVASRKIGHYKWQLVIATVVVEVFGGAIASVIFDTEGMAITFSTISAFALGYLEPICLAGGPVMHDSKHLGLSTGAQFTIRGTLSALARKYSLGSPNVLELPNV